ncbi:MAG: methylenetetrahydrofolate--tRNA-(uracil-5-)-methyltransferase TrmFO [Candidatus Sericytochromatia bacterium]|nr:MAG: methylenetetrahydrofolate--tRNA-(uracil-5-)-methyltransferase TrmFO [Candidatus Sericytochromatia bacterium]
MVKINVIGGGFAGVEAAWQIAKRGLEVNLYEMRPIKMTPAHHTDKLAELVCSNSLGSKFEGNASSLLKEELKLLDSIILRVAEKNSIPAGLSLSVDREKFSEDITKEICSNPLINVVREEIKEIDFEAINIIATGPLTSDSLAKKISELTGSQYLYFFDAAAPIVEYDSLNLNIIFEQSRYDKGEGFYLNCPFNKEQYDLFINELLNAELAEVKDFDIYSKNKPFFEGCMPIEELARRGHDTPRYGPMRPVGLINPKDNKRPYAVVQLRQDNAIATLYNIVGFQTQLKWNEQKRVFRLIPGLENAEFVRFGVMHRNTFINSPKLLNKYLQLKCNNKIFFAGLLTGVEGYVESCAMGTIAGINVYNLIKSKEMLELPNTTMIGALINYIINADSKNFQPINSNWGILKQLDENIKDKKLRNIKYRERALRDLKFFLKSKEFLLK